MLKYFWLAIYPILYPYEIHVFHVTTSIRGPIQHHVTWPKVTCFFQRPSLSRGKAFEGSRLRQILTIFGILGDGGGWEFHFLEDSAETYRFFTAKSSPTMFAELEKGSRNFASASNSEDSAEMMILLKDDGCWWLLMVAQWIKTPIRIENFSHVKTQFVNCISQRSSVARTPFFFAQLQRFFKKIIEAHYRINIQQISDFHVISL